MIKSFYLRGTSLFSHQHKAFTSYDILPLSHSEVIEKYFDPTAKCDSLTDFVHRICPKLNILESHMLRWRRGKWSFRISHLITSPDAKQSILEQVDVLRERWKTIAIERQQANNDRNFIIDSFSDRSLIDQKNIISEQGQKTVQDHVASLRWEGKVDQAREVRDAWRRLTEHGNQESSCLLERLCCFYGIIKNNAFGDAFTNIIERNQQTNEIVLNRADVYAETAQLLMSNIPVMDVFYAFLGFQPRSHMEEGAGYGQAIGKYLVMNLASKYEILREKNKDEYSQINVRSQALHSDVHKREKVLFDASPEALFYSNLNGEEHWPNSNTPKYLHFRRVDCLEIAFKPVESAAYPEGSSNDFYIATLILIASENPYERNVQIPEQKEKDGISRRLSFVLGVPVDNVRLRVLFLPPQHLDKLSVNRLVEVLGKEVWRDEFQFFHGQCSKDLDSSQVDYAEQRKRMPQEEWREV